MRASSRSLSFSRSRSRPVSETESSRPAESTPMMTTTTRISISVKPAATERDRGASEGTPSGGATGVSSLFRQKLHGWLQERVAPSVGHVPVADVGVLALTAGLAVGPECVEVVVFNMSAGARVLVLITPRVLAHVLQIATRTPVSDCRIGRLRGERGQPLFGGRVLGVVEAEHGERRLERLDVLLRLRDARLVDLADDLRHDDRGQQADDDHDDHDLDEGEATRASERSATLG